MTGITLSQSIAPSAPAATIPGNAQPPHSPSSPKPSSFRTYLDKAITQLEKSGETLNTLDAKLRTAGADTSPSQLISMQITAHRVGLYVEGISKLADGLGNTVRKLQSPG